MTKPSIKERTRQLGMSHGVATYKLRKMLLFALAQRCDLDTCFQCNEKITSIDDFSVEHKIPWYIVKTRLVYSSIWTTLLFHI